MPCVALRDQTPLGQPYSLGGSLARGWQLLLGAFWPIAAISLLFDVPQAIIETTTPLTRYTIFGSYLGGTYILLVLLGATFGIIADTALYLVMNDVANQRKPKLWRAIARAFRLWPRIFAVNFEVGLRVGLWSLLLLVPGIVEGTELAVAIPAAIAEPNLDAVPRSRELTQGHRWSVFGLMAVLVVGVVLATTLLSMLRGRLVLFARSDAPWVILVSAWVLRGMRVLISAFAPAAKLAAYYGLRHTQQLLDSP